MCKNQIAFIKSKQMGTPSLGKGFYFDVYRHLSCKNQTNVDSTNNEDSENAINTKHVFEDILTIFSLGGLTLILSAGY